MPCTADEKKARLLRHLNMLTSANKNIEKLIGYSKMAADLSLLEELGEIVSNLTTSGDPSLNNDLLKKLKAICRKSEVYVRHAYHLVLTQLKKNHAEIRLSSFQIINELFLRSHTFRELLLIDFQVFLELTVETDHKQALPPPQSAAKVLKEKALQAIESWYQKFGPHYKKLDLGYSFLKRVKNVEFNAVSARTQAERRQSEERERRKRNFINGQIIRVENEMSEMVSEMELCVTEIENCFKLLLPHPDEYEVHCDDETACGEWDACSSSETMTKGDLMEDSDTRELKEVICENQVIESRLTNTTKGNTNFKDDGSSSSLQVDQVETETSKDDSNKQLLSDHGLGIRSYHLSIKVDSSGPQIKETVDNSIVLKTVQEMHKEMTHKHLPMINKWLSVLSKGEGTQCKIQQLIDLKRTLEAAKDKFFELKITPMADAEHKHTAVQGVNNDDDGDDDDTDDFEDVPEKEGLELVIPPSKRAEYGLEPLPTTHKSLTESQEKTTGKETGFLKQFGADPRDLGDPTSRATALFQVRNQLSDLSSSSVSKETSETVIDERRKKLLEKAPVVPFDMDLYFWGDATATTHKMVKTYLENNNWASKEHEGEYVISSEKEARPTRMVTFAGSFEPVKWSCRAPLPNGKLCPRRDRVKCPFHGKIIPRDETGSPVNTTGAGSDLTTTSEENATSTSKERDKDSAATDWKEIGLEIEAATGLDLGGKSKRKRKSHSKRGDKKKLKGSGLTDLKKQKNTAKARLEKIVLNKKAMQRVADEMNSIATKRCLDKFANQFNYSLH